jgi:hypothetical protein
MKRLLATLAKEKEQFSREFLSGKAQIKKR